MAVATLVAFSLSSLWSLRTEAVVAAAPAVVLQCEVVVTPAARLACGGHEAVVLGSPAEVAMAVVGPAAKILRTATAWQADMPVGVAVAPSCHDVEVPRVVAPDPTPLMIVPPGPPVVVPPPAPMATTTALRPVTWLPEGLVPCHHLGVLASPHLHVRSKPANVCVRAVPPPPPRAHHEAPVVAVVSRVTIAKAILGPAAQATLEVTPPTEDNLEHGAVAFVASTVDPLATTHVLLAQADVSIIGASDPNPQSEVLVRRAHGSPPAVVGGLVPSVASEALLGRPHALLLVAGWCPAARAAVAGTTMSPGVVPSGGAALAASLAPLVLVLTSWATILVHAVVGVAAGIGVAAVVCPPAVLPLPDGAVLTTVPVASRATTMSPPMCSRGAGVAVCPVSTRDLASRAALARCPAMGVVSSAASDASVVVSAVLVGLVRPVAALAAHTVGRG